MIGLKPIVNRRQGCAGDTVGIPVPTDAHQPILSTDKVLTVYCQYFVNILSIEIKSGIGAADFPPAASTNPSGLAAVSNIVRVVGAGAVLLSIR